MFKKILKWVGILLLGLIVLFVLLAAYTTYKQSEYSETAVPYIKQIIPIISEWNPEKSKPLFVPSTFDNVSDEDFSKLFKWFSKLGALESIEEPQFSQVTSGATVRDGANTIVTYVVLAHYGNGDAKISIRLLDLGSSFEIYHLNINSQALIE
jgi:hypothetical protein